MGPRITVVTPSYNQGRFIARTIESVRQQEYANVEHIVVDGMSTDETPAVLARYPHLRVLRESDRGQAEAINKGFRLATGDIYCFLNSDDTLLPGALARVAHEIEPTRGRHIVLGRCIHIDEDDEPLSEEHPSFYLHHRRVLEIWKQNVIPQPATFWTAEVWRRCGPLDEREHMVPDYDLFCRCTRHYPIHFIDQLLATYRLHPSSKTCTRTETAVLQAALRVSRRYWGPASRPLYWRMLASLAGWRLERWLRRKYWSAELLEQCQQARADGNTLLALTFLAGAMGCAPDLVFRREVLPRMGRHLERLLPQRDGDLWRPDRTLPATLTWRGFTGQHSNGCVGPIFVKDLHVSPVHEFLELELEGVVQPMPWPLKVEVYLDDRAVFQRREPALTTLSVRVPLETVRPGVHELKVVSSTYLVPHDFHGNGDYRPLSLRVRSVRLLGDTERLRPSGFRCAA